jgi:UDP-glucose:(heptosyl)LPS alpha-1,3-glucosyltransferase
MNKIYFLRAHKTASGGAEVYLTRLVGSLLSQNIECEMIYSNIPRFLPSWVRVILFNLRLCMTKNNRFYFSLERVSCPDIYRAGDGVHKVFLETENKSKTNPLHWVYLYLERKCFLNAKKVIANSEMVKKQILDTFPVDEAKIEVIYNGVTVAPFDKDKVFTLLAKEFNIKAEDKIILYVGSGFKRKGVDAYLHILSQLKSQKFKAFIVGKESNLSYYIKLADSLGLADRVFFTGVRLDVNNFYSISDIFLLPTRYEPFSNVVLEAMSFKTAVITTKQNGASEALDSRFIMSSSEDESVVGVIDELLGNEKMLAQVKDHNFKKVANEFSLQLNVQRTLCVIKEVMGQ